MGFNPVPNTKLASYERGFGDFTMKADIDSFREINYINENRQLLVFSDLYNENDPVAHAPRHMLRTIVNQLKEQYSINVKVQCDIHFSLFYDRYKKFEEHVSHAVPITEHTNQYSALNKPRRVESFTKIKNSLKCSNVIVEHIEGGPTRGQFSMSISSTEPIEFCDNITLIKLVSGLSNNSAQRSWPTMRIEVLASWQSCTLVGKVILQISNLSLLIMKGTISSSLIRTRII
jgi:glutamine synthetase